MAIYLPQQPSFMDQFLGTGVMNTIMKSIMMGVQNRREDEKTIQGLEQQGYTEADYTAPTPQEAAAGYGGSVGSPGRAAPGQYQGQLYDKSRQVGVAGRQFQRPPEPQFSYNVVTDSATGRPMLELMSDKKLSGVKPLALDQAPSTKETEKREKQLDAQGRTIERTYRVKNGKRVKDSEGKWRTVKDKPLPSNVWYGTDPITKQPIIGSSKGPVNLRTVKTPSAGGLAPKTLGRLSGEQQKSITDLGDIERISVAVNELVNPREGATPEQFRTAKGLKRWMGPVSGRARNFASGWRADPHWVKLKTRASKLRTIIYGLSGKMINATEDKWLKEDILPALSEPGPNFEVKLKELETWARAKQKSSIKAFRNQGYIVGDTTQPSFTQETVPPNGRKPLSSF